MQELKESEAISLQELDEAKYRVDSLRSTVAAASQQLALLEEGTRTEQVEAQESIVASQAAQLERLIVRLSEKTILAPYSGFVQGRLTDEGDVVAPGQILMNVVESEFLEVHVGLPTELCTDVSSLRKNVQILPGQEGLPEIRAELERISPVVDPTTRTRRCIFRVDSPGTSVAIGGSVRVVVHEAEDSDVDGFTPWVRGEALIAGPRGLWALLVVEPCDEGDYKLAARQVEVLRVRGDWSQIRGTIAPGQRYVAEGTHRVVAGQVVEIAHD